jgi:DNA-binding response OmpR family regulator
VSIATALKIYNHTGAMFLKKYQEISNIPGPILITDDDKNMCEVLTDIIEKQFNGFSIETANDGEEALQYIDRRSPSLLILDLKMPRKTGFEVLKELSTRSEKFPILVLSSDTRSKKEIIQQSHISNNRFEYLHKTFSTKEFVDTIQNMLSLQEN